MIEEQKPLRATRETRFYENGNLITRRSYFPVPGQFPLAEKALMSCQRRGFFFLC
jgi:hypothetical protein